jgi:hypothetical protein
MPSAMAMPPRLMTVAGIPSSLMAAKVSNTTSGSVTMGTSALRP